MGKKKNYFFLKHNKLFFCFLILLFITSCIKSNKINSNELTYDEYRWATPPSPENLSAIKVETGIRITWEPPLKIKQEKTYGDHVLYYVVYKLNDLDYERIGETKGLYYIDTKGNEEDYYSAVAIFDNIVGTSEITGEKPNAVKAS